MTGGVCSSDHVAFISDVLQAGGCFTGGQAVAWLGQHFPGWADGRSPSQIEAEYREFVKPFFLPTFRGRTVLRGLAEMRSLYPDSHASFAQFTYTKLYRVAGLGRTTDHRSDLSSHGRLARLLVFDYLCSINEPWTWYGNSRRQTAFFWAVGVRSEAFPATFFGTGGSRKKAYFAQSLVVGVRGWRVRFVVPCPVPVRRIAQIAVFGNYGRLFGALRARGLYVELVLVFARRPDVYVGDWCRNQAVPPAREDRVRFAHFMELYTLKRCRSQDPGPVTAAYGGSDSLDLRLTAIEGILAGPSPAVAPMEVVLWHGNRFASDDWIVPPEHVLGAR